MDPKVDVLVILGAPAFVLAAQQATRTIPIVMAGLSVDPVSLGLANSFAAGRQRDRVNSHRRTRVGRQAAPAAQGSRPRDLASGSSQPTEHTRRCPDRKCSPCTEHHAPVDTHRCLKGDHGNSWRHRAETANALVVHGGPKIVYQREIVQFAATRRLPAIYVLPEFATAGGLMAYGANYNEILRRSAGYVSKILKGAKPGELPIEQPTKFQLVVNLKTAKALGLTIPNRSWRARIRLSSECSHVSRGIRSRRPAAAIFRFVLGNAPELGTL